MGKMTNHGKSIDVTDDKHREFLMKGYAVIDRDRHLFNIDRPGQVDRPVALGVGVGL